MALNTYLLIINNMKTISRHFAQPPQMAGAEFLGKTISIRRGGSYPMCFTHALVVPADQWFRIPNRPTYNPKFHSHPNQRVVPVEMLPQTPVEQVYSAAGVDLVTAAKNIQSMSRHRLIEIGTVYRTSSQQLCNKTGGNTRDMLHPVVLYRGVKVNVHMHADAVFKGVYRCLLRADMAGFRSLAIPAHISYSSDPRTPSFLPSTVGAIVEAFKAYFHQRRILQDKQAGGKHTRRVSAELEDITIFLPEYVLPRLAETAVNTFEKVLAADHFEKVPQEGSYVYIVSP